MSKEIKNVLAWGVKKDGALIECFQAREEARAFAKAKGGSVIRTKVSEVK